MQDGRVCSENKRIIRKETGKNGQALPLARTQGSSGENLNKRKPRTTKSSS